MQPTKVQLVEKGCDEENGDGDKSGDGFLTVTLVPDPALERETP
jgi:hypothetical protein